MRMSADSALSRLVRNGRSPRAWLRIDNTSPWWTRVLLTAGAQLPDLSGADLRRASLGRVFLDRARLRNADLTDTWMRRATLTSADLTGADLTGADLTEADLRGANLTNAKLRGTDLRGADLTSTRLDVADLDGADFRRADLSGADLQTSLNVRNARLVKVFWSEKTRWPNALTDDVRERSEALGGGTWLLEGLGDSNVESEPLVPAGS